VTRARSDGGRLLAEVAAAQYLHALEALQCPKIPLSGRSYVLTLSRLEKLKNAANMVEEDIRMMRKIRHAMRKHQPQLVRYLATKDWNQNLRDALHLAVFPWLNRVLGIYVMIPDSKLSAVFESVPQYYILAYRHATRMFVEASNFAEAVRAGQDDIFGIRHVTPILPVSDASTRRHVEDQLPGSVAQWYQFWKTGRFLLNTNQWQDGKSATIRFDMCRLTHLPTGIFMSEIIDRRIHNILSERDQYVTVDPTTVENLQSKGPPDINAARHLTESFVDPDTAPS
jgi:hypothetical protein